MQGSLKVKGLREAQRAFRKLSAELDGETREGLKKVGEIVAEDARGRFDRYSPVSAAGLKPKVLLKSVKVQQTKRKRGGQHPEWGALQMRKALIPAREAKAGEARHEFEKVLDRMCGRAGF